MVAIYGGNHYSASNLFDVYKLTSSKRSNSSSVASIQWDIPRNEMKNWSFGLLRIVLTEVCRWRYFSSRSLVEVIFSIRVLSMNKRLIPISVCL